VFNVHLVLHVAATRLAVLLVHPLEHVLLHLPNLAQLDLFVWAQPLFQLVSTVVPPQIVQMDNLVVLQEYVVSALTVATANLTQDVLAFCA